MSLRGKIPPVLDGLYRLATDLQWTYDEVTKELFAKIDGEQWAATENPALLLHRVDPARLVALAEDPDYVAAVHEAAMRLEEHLTTPLWFQREFPDDPAGAMAPLVAYFSPEFGLASAVPQYAGGLGVLAGDHLKTANDLGVPLIAVGLLYRYGYFTQRLKYGYQWEWDDPTEPEFMGLEPTETTVSIELSDRHLTARVWRAEIGRVTLLLLDTDIPENEADLRPITDRLYGGDSRHRLHQEILLGMGGVRALRALGYRPTVFHTNEGHAAFMGLERIREWVLLGMSFDEALERVRATTVFTTHTPVPAGIDRFTRPEIVAHLGFWAHECGLSEDDLMRLGHFPDDAPDARFNMAVLALKLAKRSNGVSELHGEVSREMFAELYPGTAIEAVPITHVTNGVHPQTWTSPDMTRLYETAIGPDWWQGDAEDWKRGLDRVTDAELWSMRQQARYRLVEYVRSQKRLACEANSWGEEATEEAVRDLLSSRVLSVGFSRRFATYKRATMILKDPDRLRRLLGDDDRPVQFIFAGKAHPQDGDGKELIRAVEHFSNLEGVRHRFVFLPDYNMRMAAALVQGCDVWLNVPVFGREASGTSGMKAALNGVLQVSRPDGWWYEMRQDGGGWSVGSPELVSDEIIAEALYELLESEVREAFYSRDEDGIPRQWVAMMRQAMGRLGPRVTSARMLREYTNIYRSGRNS